MHAEPELAVRSLVHRLGFRFRLHDKKLPGKPDLVFRSRRKVIQVHGCFWHRHTGCSYATTPKSRVDFWQHKFTQNVERDTFQPRPVREVHLFQGSQIATTARRQQIGLGGVLGG